MRRYIEAEEVEKRIDIVLGSEPKAWDKKALKELKMYVVHAVPTADVRENVQLDVCPLYGGACGYPSGECYDCPRHGNFRENVRGEWIRRDSRYVGWISFDCSVCGETLELDRETSNDFKYCPFCGAEMRGR